MDTTKAAGEMTIAEIWDLPGLPPVYDDISFKVLDPEVHIGDPIEAVSWDDFTIDHTGGLRIYYCHGDKRPMYEFPADLKVRIKEDHLELPDGMRLYVMSARPTRFI